MPFTIEFLYENGERVLALDDEVLDEDRVKAILNFKVFDTITLGSGCEKLTLQVLKINHKFVSAKLSGKDEDDMHHEYIVKAI